MNTEKYVHHGKEVTVVSELKGKHRDVCLCYSCVNFHPGAENNCPIARKVYSLCVEENLTTPVIECPAYEVKNNE